VQESEKVLNLVFSTFIKLYFICQYSNDGKVYVIAKKVYIRAYKTAKKDYFDQV
jgi:hypothetical protein